MLLRSFLFRIKFSTVSLSSPVFVIMHEPSQGEPHERSSFFELDHRYYRLVPTVCQPKMTKLPHMTWSKTLKGWSCWDGLEIILLPVNFDIQIGALWAVLVLKQISTTTSWPRLCKNISRTEHVFNKKGKILTQMLITAWARLLEDCALAMYTNKNTQIHITMSNKTIWSGDMGKHLSSAS